MYVRILLIVLIAIMLNFSACTSQTVEPTSTDTQKLPEVASYVDDQTFIDTMQEYIDNSIFQPIYGGKTFCSTDVFGTETLNNVEQVYMWLYCKEYTYENEILAETDNTYSTIALMVVRINEDATYNINAMRVVRVEHYYYADVMKFFPETYQTYIFEQDFNAMTTNNVFMNDTIQKHASEYFEQQ